MGEWPSEGKKRRAALPGYSYCFASLYCRYFVNLNFHGLTPPAHRVVSAWQWLISRLSICCLDYRVADA